MTTGFTCPHEGDVLELATLGRWPGRADAALRAHVATCAICADLAEVAGVLAEWQDTALSRVRVPDASHVWRHAERRARAEAARRATQPVLVVELAAVAAIIVMLVAWGPTMAGLAGLAASGEGWLTGGWQTLSELPSAIGSWWQTSGWPAGVTSTVHWSLLTLAAWAVLVPIALSLAGLADRVPRRGNGRSEQSGPVA
jgi:hypothetical protein